MSHPVSFKKNISSMQNLGILVHPRVRHRSILEEMCFIRALKSSSERVPSWPYESVGVIKTRTPKFFLRGNILPVLWLYFVFSEKVWIQTTVSKECIEIFLQKWDSISDIMKKVFDLYTFCESTKDIKFIKNVCNLVTLK